MVIRDRSNRNHSTRGCELESLGRRFGLIADGETVVEDVDCVATSFPTFADTLRKLGADVEHRT